MILQIVSTLSNMFYLYIDGASEDDFTDCFNTLKATSGTIFLKSLDIFLILKMLSTY